MGPSRTTSISPPHLEPIGTPQGYRGLLRTGSKGRSPRNDPRIDDADRDFGAPLQPRMGDALPLVGVDNVDTSGVANLFVLYSLHSGQRLFPRWMVELECPESAIPGRGANFGGSGGNARPWAPRSHHSASTVPQRHALHGQWCIHFHHSPCCTFSP